MMHEIGHHYGLNDRYILGQSCYQGGVDGELTVMDYPCFTGYYPTYTDVDRVEGMWSSGVATPRGGASVATGDVLKDKRISFKQQVNQYGQITSVLEVTWEDWSYTETSYQLRWWKWNWNTYVWDLIYDQWVDSFVGLHEMYQYFDPPPPIPDFTYFINPKFLGYPDTK